MSVGFWTGRLLVEQTQIEAIDRRARSLHESILLNIVRDPDEAKRLETRWIALLQTLSIMHEAREALRVRLIRDKIIPEDTK